MTIKMNQLDEQSTLKSELAKSKKLVEKLRKEIKVNVSNFSMHFYIRSSLTTFFVNIVHIVVLYVGNEDQN